MWEHFTRLASQWDVFSQGTAGLAMATIIDPAWGIKTQSRKDFLMDLCLFYQLHLAMFLGDLFRLELPRLAGKNGEENVCQQTPVCFWCQKFFLLLHLFFSISIFYSKQLQKIQFFIAAFVFKVRRQKIKSTKI